MQVFLETIFVIAKIWYICLEGFVRMFIPVKPKDIRGQVALITGGGQGIGRELAIKLSAQDAKIALWDVNKERLKETYDELRIRGATVFTYVVDVTDTAAIKTAADAVRRDLGQVDILVNNAGILNCKDILTLTETDIKRTVDVNTVAHFWTVREFLPSMLSKGSGHIVTIASMASKVGGSYLTDYCTSKYGAYGFTEALAEELRFHHKQSDIYTTTVCPLMVGTNLINAAPFASRVGYRDRFGKVFEPKEVADEVVKGVLKNQPYVYVPSSASAINLTGLLPRKAREVLSDFLQVGFYFK